MSSPAGRVGGVRGAGGIAALLLTIAVLSPYPKLLTGTEIPIPDDLYTSDLANGEFPARVEAARLVTAGEAPFWTPRVSTGAPLGLVDPASLALFSVLPPGLALGWLIALLLLTAALGTYALARHVGASRSGAFLAGFAFAWSGFFVCQLRHLGELGTVALFPLAAYCLERAAAAVSDALREGDGTPARRGLGWLVAFGAIFGLQVLQAFPQSAYICALAYAALVAARALWLFARGEPRAPVLRRISPALGLVAASCVAVVLGALVGMIAVVPLWELGSVSDRGAGVTYEWATQYNYWPRNALTFLFPYVNGDLATMTYEGPSIFWEDYGYAGLATVLLAALAGWVHRRRFGVRFWAATAVLSYAIVLGSATPLYRVVHELVPGMNRFRGPTRFLFLVDLALAVLGGVGLTWLQELVARRVGSARLRLAPAALGAAVVALTAADLVHHNRHQNPFADAGRWLTPPRTVSTIMASGEGGRVFTPGSMKLHFAAFTESHGWTGDLDRYYANREFIQPDSNLLHGVATVDGYAGIAPAWSEDLLGSHNRVGWLGELWSIGPSGALEGAPPFFDWLEALSVRWMILPGPASHPRLEHVASAPPAELYRLPGALPRARVVTRARFVPSLDALRRLVAAGMLDPRREVALQEAAAAPVLAALPRDGDGGAGPGEARIVVDRATEVVIDATAPRGGLLLLADTFYPGWRATVDGVPTRIYRANLAHRAVPLAPGAHRVTFTYRPRSVAIGLALTTAGVAALAAAALALRLSGRAGRSTRALPPA